MKLFKISDFIEAKTDEGYRYHHCIMGNGMEIQIDSLSWGWTVGVYDIHGKLIQKENQPFLITLAGGVDHETSHQALLETVAKLYDRVLRRKRIEIKGA